MKFSLNVWRANAKMSQVAVAKEMNVTKQTISNWERGLSSPTLEQARKLSSIYGCTINDFLLPTKSN